MAGIDITGIGSAITGLDDILGKFIPDANQKAQVQAQIEQAVIKSRGDLFDAAKDVAIADANSQGWLQRNERAIAGIWVMSLITWIAVVAPIFGSGVTKATIEAMDAVPGGLWATLAITLGGYPLLNMVKAAGGRK